MYGRRKYKYYFICLVLLLAFIFFLKSEKKLNISVDLQYVVVHLDLKGSPPKLKYLESLLPIFKNHGVTGILMEYEDMFPYEGRLVNLSATTCYKRHELKMFVSKALDSGMEIIPLVQTFGHLEHALKLEEFVYLREVAEMPKEICPSKPGSQELIEDMLKQVITFHSSIVPLKRIHIGCDEVYDINQCEQCRKRKLNDTFLFLKHVHAVDNIVRKISPRTKVLIWDDMLQKSKEPLQTVYFNLSNIEPVCWNYKPNFEVSHASLYNYHKIFNNIWVASAFKGADGNTNVLPKLKERFLNNLQWLRFISKYKFGGETKVYRFNGIILTGWSRYSHMDPLCELLPASMPSLILNLLLIKTVCQGIDFEDLHHMNFCDFFNKHLRVNFEKKFKCTDVENTECSFENNELHTKLAPFLDFESYKTEIANIQYDEYNSKIGNINMINVQRDLLFLKRAFNKFSSSNRKINKFMSQFYEKDVIEEYLHDKIIIYERDARNKMIFLQRYSKMQSWKRRPYSINNAKLEL